MSQSKCESCGKMTDAGRVCVACTAQLLELLEDVPDTLNELRIAATRQAKFSTGGGASSGETPVPFNARASRAGAEYTKMLRDWQGKLADHLDPPRAAGDTSAPYRVSEPVRFISPVAAASWMWVAISLRGVSHWSETATMIRRLVEKDREIEELIDRPVPQEYLGECELLDDDGQPCGGDVYAARDDVYGECRRCKGRCDAQEQRLLLLTWFDERLMTAAEIARMTVWLGMRMDREQVRKRINQWHSRTRVPCVPVCAQHVVDGETSAAPPTFRFRDVRLLLEATEHGKATA